MSLASNSQSGTVNRLSSTLFLISGCLMLGHAGLLGLQAFSGLAAPPDFIGPAGHLVALVGLIGLYPGLVDRWPMTTRAGGAVAAVAIGGWGVTTGTRFLEVIGAVGSDLLPGAFVGLMLLATVLTYVIFGVATARVTEWPSRVGLLVGSPAVFLLVVLGASLVVRVAAREGFVISVGLALAMVLLGYTFRTGAAGTGQVDRTGDVTMG